MKKIGKIEIKKPAKFLILTLVLLTIAYVFTGMKESFSSFNVETVENQNYCTKAQDRFLFFYDDAAGQYIDKGSPIFFEYTLENGKLCLFNLGEKNESADLFMTLYYVKSGLYSRSNRLYFYPY